MMFRSILAISLCLMTFISQAQKLTKPTIEQLRSTICASDSTAPAEIIYSKCFVSYSVSPLLMHVHYKYQYKIYNDEGEKYGKIEIPYYTGTGKGDRVKDIMATTYNLTVGGAITEVELNKKDIYKEKSSEYYSMYKMALPDIKTGSIFNLSYTIEKPAAYSVPVWYFQNFIPTQYSEYVLRVSPEIGLTPIATGFVELEHSKGFNNFHSQNEIKMIARNMEAIKEDDYVLNINDYRSSIRYEVHSTNFPGDFFRQYSESWQQIGDNILDDSDFGKQIKKKFSQFDPVLAEAKDMENEKKIQFLYDYVRTNYVSEDEIGLKAGKGGLKKVISEKKGSKGELNLLLLNLLLKAGINAKPLATRYRSHGMLNHFYPSLRNLNYLLVHVEDETGKTYVLDGSSKYYPLNTLPSQGINLQGLLISKKSSHIVEIKNPNRYKVVELINYKFSEDLNYLEGEGIKKLFGTAAIRYCQDADKIDADVSQLIYSEKNVIEDTEENEEEFEDQYVIIDTADVSDPYKPIKLTIEESLYSPITKLDNKIFIDADLGYGVMKNPWVEEEREFPIFFIGKTRLQKVFKIKIPPGYEVFDTPDELNMIMTDSQATFRYSLKEINDELIVNYNLAIKAPVILPGDYPNLKAFFEKVIAKQREKIVMKRT